MTRKKINKLIILGVLFLYIIGLGISFTTCESLVDNRFESDATSALQSIESFISLIVNNEKETSNMNWNDIVQNACNNAQTDYPYIVAVYDKNGNIVAKTDCYLLCSAFKNNIPLTDLSVEDKEQIKRFSNKCKGLFEAYKLDYAIIDDEIIPVAIYLRSNDYKQTEKITVSDYDATHTINTTNKKYNKVSIDLFLYDMDSSMIKRNEYEKLYNYIKSSKMREDAKTAINNEMDFPVFQESGGGLYSEDGIEEYKIVKFNDEVYYILLKFSHNYIYDAISSYEFKYSLFAQTIMFGLSTIIFLIIANKFYSKRKAAIVAKDTFTSAAAHELKTPLAIIQNQCEFILEDIAPEKNQEYIESIYGESLRMNKLVIKLLQYNRLATETKIAKEKINLSDITNAEINKYSQLHSIEADITENAIINGNYELLTLAIDNYLSNAVKNADEAIKVSLSQVGKGYKLSVFNDGASISKEHEKNLWEVFYKGDNKNTNGNSSTGIGLAICRQIFSLHKFKYGFTNHENGVEFYFITK